MNAEHVFKRPLFRRFPHLAEKLPLVELADLPTPVRPLSCLGSAIGVSSLWLKDDGRSSPEYGGNKVRKLELLLGAAKARGARSVMTFGYAGSNHATATAVHASRIGLGSISILLPQRNAAYVRKNLLASAAAGAELHEYPSQPVLVAGAAVALVRRLLRDRALPFVIAPGGSSALGTVGFVNAAFELAEQIAGGKLPAPVRIYAAAGSLGTVVGLGIGLAALGLPTQVVAVRVVDERFVNLSRLRALWASTLALLRAGDPSFPDVGDPDGRIELRSECFGGVYALETDSGRDAMGLARDLERLDLDITYTAKALACLIADARAGVPGIEPVLYWNTVSTAEMGPLVSGAKTSDLPPRLRRYFADERASASLRGV